jgi:hypothetical protein
MKDLNELLDIKNRITDELLNPDAEFVAKAQPRRSWLARNIVGVAVGAKTIKGEIKSSPSLTILVRAKLDREELGDYLFSKRLAGLGLSLEEDETDVVETGALSSFSGLAGPLNQLTIGADLSIAGQPAHGTLCAFVRVPDREGVFLLSAGHVLDSHKNSFSLVASRDAVVARIERTEDQLDLLPGHGGSGRAQQDAAIARLLHGVQPNYRLPGSLPRLSSSQPRNADLWTDVTKAGKTVTSGTVIAVDATLYVEYPAQTSRIKHQALVSSRHAPPFAEAGDSGALVVASGPHDQLFATGMVIAAGDPASLKPKGGHATRFAVVSPMERILGDLGAQLLVG